ncbi:MAG TPA: hypothetical protein VLW53_10885, partial [Candidatus Eisenbacteria bacterium]|nr:hypothetical protein [Candidatus Eisenbacteria bacterium]
MRDIASTGRAYLTRSTSRRTRCRAAAAGSGMPRVSRSVCWRGVAVGDHGWPRSTASAPSSAQAPFTTAASSRACSHRRRRTMRRSMGRASTPSTS